MQKTLSVVNLRAIRSNAEKVRNILGSRKFYAVVKADAYGHGAEEVAKCLEDLVEGFCVAIVDEGAALRNAGISKPILVFTPPLDKEDAARSQFYNLTVTVNSLKTALIAKELLCHIKVNTGMNRNGCNLRELSAVLDSLKSSNIQAVYSHLYAPENAERSRRQLEIFNTAESLVRAKAPHIWAHIAASGGILRGGEYLKEGARCGILLYGYTPSGFNISGFSPALRVYARRIQTTEFIGGGVGYNAAEKNYKKLSTYRLGYADGFRRGVPLGEKTLCMDAFIKEGGKETECVMQNAQVYAKRLGTIPYEVLTSVTRRSEIIYER